MWTVTTGSTAGVSASNVNAAVVIVQAAAEYWGRYIDTSLANIEIRVDFVNLGGTTLATGSTTFFFSHSSNGLDVYEPTAINELQTGTDLNGSDPDIEIEIDISEINSNGFYLGAPVNGVSSGPPQNQIDLFTVMVHEIGHGLGFLSFLDENNNDRSTFDLFVNANGPPYSFSGPNSVAIFGGNVPLHNTIAHTDNALGLVMGPTIGNGEVVLMTPLDIALFQDFGAPVLSATSGR